MDEIIALWEQGDKFGAVTKLREFAQNMVREPDWTKTPGYTAYSKFILRNDVQQFVFSDECEEHLKQLSQSAYRQA